MATICHKTLVWNEKLVNVVFELGDLKENCQKKTFYLLFTILWLSILKFLQP